MVVHEDPDSWRIPGLMFPDDREPMSNNTSIRSMLLHARFCAQGKEAPRRLKYESNLRAIFKACIFFYPYASLGDYYWDRVSRCLCHYFAAYLVKEVFHVFLRARKCYLEEEARAGDGYIAAGRGTSEVIRAIDACIRRSAWRSARQPRLPASELKDAFHKALETCEPDRWVWHSHTPTSDAGEGSISIKGRAERSDFQSQSLGRREDQSHPFGSPQGPRAPAEKLEEQDERHMEIGPGPSLASRISFPSRSVSITATESTHESDTPEDEVDEDNEDEGERLYNRLLENHATNMSSNPLKRAAPFFVDPGPSKRRVSGPDPAMTNSPQEQEDLGQNDVSPYATGDSNFTTPNEEPGDLGEPEQSEDLGVNIEGAALNPEQATTVESTGQELEKGHITKMADQLKAIESLMSQKFDGIEAHVKAIQDSISQSSAPPAIQEPPKIAAPSRAPYLEEYFRSRNHENLVKSIGNEIYKLKKDLLHGLDDHQHDRTSDAWKKMEKVWIGLDYAEQVASSL